MTDLKKAVSEIKSFLTSKPPIEAVPTVVTTPKPEAPPKPVEEIDGIRIRGIPESNEKEARLRQEHDLAQVQKLLAHVEVNADIGDVIRLGRHEEVKTRTILSKIPNAYQRRMILLSARKVKTFGEPVFLSRQLKEEADRENQALMRRRELINDGTEPNNLRVRDGNLSVKAQNGSRRIHPKSTGPID